MYSKTRASTSVSDRLAPEPPCADGERYWRYSPAVHARMVEAAMPTRADTSEGFMVHPIMRKRLAAYIAADAAQPDLGD